MDHDADTESMQISLNQLNSDWVNAQQSVVDLHFELKKALTADEWALVFSGE